MSYGKLHLEDVPDKMLEYFNRMKGYDCPFQIIVGTDSQNFSITKMVSVIAVICEGHGGIFFYKITNQKIIHDVRTKLHVETNASLVIADKLVDMLSSNNEYQEMFMNSTFSIHVDAGTSTHGKTRELIPELVGWVKATGYDCHTKPESFVASSIADMISK